MCLKWQFLALCLPPPLPKWLTPSIKPNSISDYSFLVNSIYYSFLRKEDILYTRLGNGYNFPQFGQLTKILLTERLAIHDNYQSKTILEILAN